MNGHVDWLSWTVPCQSEPRTAEQSFYIAKNMSERLCEGVSEIFFNSSDYEQKAGRAPYRYQLVARDTGVRIFGGGATQTCLIEASGRGCDAIHEPTLSRYVVGALASRVSRFDYAVDARCGLLPVEFTREPKHNKFRAKSVINSDTGQTVYVGSPRSDRFARVYRYNPPHPRSELLRVEFVFRRGLAKSASERFAKSKSEKDFIGSCFATWGFRAERLGHTVLEAETIRTPERSQHEGKTVTWLYRQVAPAVRRLIDDDALNVADWLEYVYNL